MMHRGGRILLEPNQRSACGGLRRTRINRASPQSVGLDAWYAGPPGSALWRELAAGNDGQLVNMDPASAWVTDSERDGYTLDFDGSDDYVDAGDLFDVGTSPFTVALWARCGTNDGAIVLKDNWGGNNNGIFVYTAAGQFRFWTGSSEITFGPIDGVNWHHLAVARDGTGSSQVRLHYDGRQVTTTTDSRSYSNSLALRFGAPNDAGHRLQGRLDDIRLHGSISLPAETIWQMYDPATRWQLYEPAAWWPARAPEPPASLRHADLLLLGCGA